MMRRKMMNTIVIIIVIITSIIVVLVLIITIYIITIHIIHIPPLTPDRDLKIRKLPPNPSVLKLGSETVVGEVTRGL